MDREMAESLSSGNTVNNVDNAYMYACPNKCAIPKSISMKLSHHVYRNRTLKCRICQDSAG